MSRKLAPLVRFWAKRTKTTLHLNITDAISSLIFSNMFFSNSTSGFPYQNYNGTVTQCDVTFLFKG